MPTKKKKYNARFPPARIKKIMQKDEEVGKVASTVPVMISRLLELFTESLILRTNELTLSVNARTLTTSHLKQIILSERKFDFLKDLVAHIPDVQANDEDGGDSNSDQGSRVKTRGRPRKKKEGEVSVPKKRGRKPKAAVPLHEDVAEEDVTDDSETEDADSNGGEDADSTSEDAAVEATTSLQNQKRRRLDESCASAPSTSSFYNAVIQSHVTEQETSKTSGETQGASASFLTTEYKREMFQPQATIAGRWNLHTAVRKSSVDQTASESCLPLNLKMAGTNTAAAAVNLAKNVSDFGQDMESYLLQHQQHPVEVNLGKTTHHTDTSGPSSLTSQKLGPLRPPPAHQPFSQALRPPFAPSCMMPLVARQNPLSHSASEFLPHSNSTGNLMVYGATPVAATTRQSAEDLPSGSHVMLDSVSPGNSLPTSTSSATGHAVHRMPVVPATFFPGAILARSMSVPHQSSAAKQLSLLTSPDEDYDS